MLIQPNSDQACQSPIVAIYAGTFATGTSKPILTPEPSAQPRINSAAIFGVRPGKPVLYKIADTAQVLSVTDAQLGLTGARIVRDLWRQKDIGALGPVFSAKVEPHGVVLVGIRQK